MEEAAPSKGKNNIDINIGFKLNIAPKAAVADAGDDDEAAVDADKVDGDEEADNADDSEDDEQADSGEGEGEE